MTYIKATELHKNRKLDEAIALYKEYLSENDDDIIAIISLGNAYYDNKEYDKSLPTYYKAIEIDENNIEARINLGDSLNKLGKHQEAIDMYKKAFDIDSSSETALLCIANTFFDLGEIEEAIKHYEKGCEKFPLSCEILTNLGDSYIALGTLEKALNIFTKLSKIEPNNTIALAKIGTILDAKDEHDKAIEAYEKLLKIAPDEAEKIIDKAVLFLQASKNAVSTNLFEQVFEIKKDDVESQFSMGKIYFKKEEFKKAIKAFSLAIEIDKSHTKSHYNLYKTLIKWAKKGYKIQAINIAKDWVKFSPENEIANQCINFLKGKKSTTQTPRTFISCVNFDNELKKINDKSSQFIENMLTDNIKDKKSYNILNLGAKNKELIKKMKTKFFNDSSKICAVDVCEKAIKNAEKENICDKIFCKEPIDFLKQNQTQWDIIIFNEIFENYANFNELIANASQRLKDDGEILFITQRDESVETNIFDEFGKFHHNKAKIKKTFDINNLNIVYSKTNIIYWIKNTPITGIYGLARKNTK
jgi:tetratricopeptide (TPR) repeat protein